MNEAPINLHVNSSFLDKAFSYENSMYSGNILL